MKRQRRTHSREFKQEAVALVVEHGYSYAAAGRHLADSHKSTPTPEKGPLSRFHSNYFCQQYHG